MAKQVTIRGDYKSFMSMRVIIDKDKWYLVQGEKKPSIECPMCGEGILGDNSPHEILDNGNVNASVVCQNIKCSFHRMINLESWDGGYVDR